MIIYATKALIRAFKKKDGDNTPPKTYTCAHRPAASTEKCLTCEAENRARIKYRWTIILGLFLPFSIQALDVTIIASALPWIAVDFNEVAQLNWIVSSFNLTSAAFIPFWGQMADIFGRYTTLMASMWFMLIGSALATGAPTNAFPVLLLGRGFQGLSCAGLNVLVRTIVADKVSLRENAVNWTIFAFVGGLSYGLGPVIGGYLTNTSWRWCFAINLPITVAALIVTFIFLRPHLLGPQPIPELEESAETGRRATLYRRLSTVDIGGQLLFLFGFGLLVLAFTWSGATYDWDSPFVLGPLVVGAVLSCGFIYWEYLMAPGHRLAQMWPWQKSMIPFELMANKDIALLFYTSFATGMAMYSVFYFCTLYFTIVEQFSPERAGVQLVFYIPGIGVGTILASYMCNVRRRHTFLPILLGSVIEAAGIAGLAYALSARRLSVIFGMMGLAGTGTGMRFQPVPLHGFGIFPRHTSSIVSLMAVAVPFGGTIGLTIMATVFNNVAGVGRNSETLAFDVLSHLPQAQQDVIVGHAKDGIVWAFVAICPFMGLCIISACLLGNVKIGKRGKNGAEDEPNQVEEGFYLLSRFGGRRGYVNTESDKVEELPMVAKTSGQSHDSVAM